MTEVRVWDENCYSPRTSRSASFPADTVAYVQGNRGRPRVVALGGCVDSLFYRTEHQIYALLDSLGVPDSSVVWPPDSRLRVEFSDLREAEQPEPVTDGIKVVLFEPSTTFYAMHGFSPQLGLLWAEVHHGPSFRLNRVERSDGGVVSMTWQSPLWPLGGPGSPEEEVEALMDSLTRNAPPPPPPPPSL